MSADGVANDDDFAERADFPIIPASMVTEL